MADLEDRIALRLPTGVRERIALLALFRDQTISEWVRGLILRELEDSEDPFSQGAER